MKEIEQYLASKQDVSEGTKTTYRNVYKKLKEIFELDKRKRIYTKPITRPRKRKTETQEEYLERIKQIKPIILTLKEVKDYSKIDLLNVIILLKRWKKKPIKHLLAYRDELYQEKEQLRQTKIIKDVNNISYDRLNNILNEAYENKRYYDFILMFLLIKVNVRNTDLIILFTSNNTKKYNQSLIEKMNKIEADKKEAYKQKETPKILKDRIYDIKTMNIIYINDNKAHYIRKNYKTNKTYGDKKIIIDNERFIKALNEIENDSIIFKSSSGGFLNRDEFNQFINRIYQKYINDKSIILNQTKIYKIVQNHFKFNENNNFKLEQMANNRGHSQDTQNKHYSKEQADINIVK